MRYMIFLLVLSWFSLEAQPYTSYKWVQHSGKNGVRKKVYSLPIGVDSTIVESYTYYNDTIQMRFNLTEAYIQKRNQADELAEQSDRLGIEADSIYAVLVDLNDGFGSVDDVPPLRAPTNPAEEYKQTRWGAILQEDEINGVG